MTLSESPPSRSPNENVGVLPPLGLEFPHSLRPLSLHAVPTTPVDPSRCACRLLPGRCSLPRSSGGSASTTTLSRPAQASLALRPAELLGHPKWPLSQGSGPARYRTKPLVSYQTYRQLSGWDFHPPVICAVGAHRRIPVFRSPETSHKLLILRRGKQKFLALWTRQPAGGHSG